MEESARRQLWIGRRGIGPLLLFERGALVDLASLWSHRNRHRAGWLSREESLPRTGTAKAAEKRASDHR